MSEGPADPAVMTKAQAFSRFNKLKAMTECIQNEDTFYALYLGVARNLLTAFPIASSTGTTPAVLPDASEVCSTMAEMLPAPSAVFTDDYFSRPTYPIKVLYNIAQFYGFDTVEDAFLAPLTLSNDEIGHKAIWNQIWFAYVLGLDHGSTRSVIDRFKNARSILTHRPPGAPSVATARVPAGTAEPASSAIHASRLAAQSAAGPVPGTTGFTTTIPGGLTDLGLARHLAFQGTAERPHQTEQRSEVRAPSPGTNTAFQPEFEDTRKATYVHQHFASTKFSGDMSQSIVMHIRDYETCARQHRLSPAQKADYFVNSLEGAARNFLLGSLTPGMAFEDAAGLMKREYDSDSRQLQVQSSLEGLKLNSFMTTHSISTESEGLTKLVEHIERLTPQCPVGFRSDENKIRYLRSAVLGHEWALTPVRSIVTHGYKFHGFVTALHESLQLSEELKTRTSPPFQTGLVDTEEEDAVKAFFQRYGRHPRDVRKSGPRGRLDATRRTFTQQRGRRDSRAFEEARRRNECFKCGAGWKPGHRCATGAITASARSRLRQGDSHVHLVRDLLRGLEEETLLISEADHPVTEGEICIGDGSHDTGDEISDGRADGETHQTSFADMYDADIAVNMLSAATNAQAPVEDFH